MKAILLLTLTELKIFMHLPPTSQYFVIGSNDHQMVDFYDASNAIYNNFGIKIILQQSSFEPFLDILKSEKERNFTIFLRSESINFRTKALTTLNNYLHKSPCHHKIVLINEELGYDEVGIQIYYSLLGSLNLVYVFSHDGYLKTHGIQVIQKAPPIKSTLITINSEPIPIEIVNIQPIILDLTRCGALDPILYFIARDFGTCIGQVFLPGASNWALAYFIQCDDSGKNDADMVKVCLVHEEKQATSSISSSLQPSPLATSSEIITAATSAPSDSQIPSKDVSVLNNPDYPFCRELALLLFASPKANVVKQLKTKINTLMVFCDSNDSSIFPDANGDFEVKKKYAKLYKEINAIIEKIRDHRAKDLQDSLKAVRKKINALCLYVKQHSPVESLTKHQPAPVVSSTSSKTPPQWFTDARRLASHLSRTSNDTQQIRKRRLEVEQRDGIVSMPLLEPYLDLKWPTFINNNVDTISIHPVIDEYSKFLKVKEDAINSNKRFGL